MEILAAILDIVRYIVPALVVYVLMRQFIRGHLATEQMKIHANRPKEDTGLRLQALERLTLLVERINILNLLLRLNNGDMERDALKNALMISVQKEYEHNLTQQNYVSGQLWQMVTLYKDNVLAAISQAHTDQSTKEGLVSALMSKGQQLEAQMLPTVKKAIRKEVELNLS